MRIPLSVLQRIRSSLVGLLSLSLAFPFGPVAAAQVGAGEIEAFASAVREHRRVLEGVRSAIDETAFDVAALGLDMAFDEADAIIDHLRATVDYEVYAGVLRGAEGALIAGAGNALDQALLLATLLTDAAYDVRIAVGELTDADAWRLIERMFAATERAPQVDADVMVDRLAAVTGTPRSDIEAALAVSEPGDLEDSAEFLVADAAHAQILGALGAAGIELGADLTATLLAEAREYAWVEYRLTGADAWVPAHIAFGDQAAPTVEATSHLEDTVPTEMVHRLRIEMYVERKLGDEFSTVALMQPWERPVPNLVGRVISVGNVPWGAGSDASILELGEDLTELAFYVPTLNGDLAPGAQAFDTLGHVLEPGVAADPAAELFQTLGGTMGQAVGILGTLGSTGDTEPDEVLALTAQWVDLVLIAPGGEERRHRRYVFDRRTPEARRTNGKELLPESVLLEGILHEQRLMVFPGALGPTYVAHAVSGDALDVLAGAERFATRAATDPNVPVEDAMGAAFADVEPRDHIQLLAIFDALGPAAGGVSYRAEPTILNLHHAITPGASATMRSGVDIVTNARRFLTLRDGAVVADAERAVLAGAWETNVERLYVERNGESSRGTYTAYAAATGHQVVAPGATEALLGLQVPDAALPALARDLESGYAVVVPTGAEYEASEFAWWRVDPLSGETLGVGHDGRGHSFTEYATLQTNASAVLLNTAMAVPGLAACAATSSGAAMWQCICSTVLTSLVTGGIGYGIGFAFFSKFAEAGAMIWSAVEISTISPVLAIPGLVPSIPCPSLSSLPGIRAQAAGSCLAA